MSWGQNVAKNIFPLSQEKGALAEALKEWEYAGIFYDLQTPHEICGLCDHPDIRYQFEITNRFNGKELLIGSECIHRFGGVSVLDDEGNALPPKDAKKKVNRDKRRMITDAQTRSLLNSLIELARKDTEFDIASFEEDYKERGAFTPKQLKTLLWRLKKYGVPHNKTYFNINIRRKKDKDALLEMQGWQIRVMWPCLSTTQKNFVLKHKTTLRV